MAFIKVGSYTVNFVCIKFRSFKSTTFNNVVRIHTGDFLGSFERLMVLLLTQLFLTFILLIRLQLFWWHFRACSVCAFVAYLHQALHRMLFQPLRPFAQNHMIQRHSMHLPTMFKTL